MHKYNDAQKSASLRYISMSDNLDYRSKSDTSEETNLQGCFMKAKKLNLGTIETLKDYVKHL